jgi:Zn ribbon nucleic-acid-binding protein
MKILSIDVGIKNLAFCLFEKSPSSEHFKISKWDVVNISEEECLKCGFVDKNVLCNKPAKYKKDDTCFCLKHSKKQQYQLPTSEQKPAFINKQKIANLYEIADSYGIKYEPKVKKIDLVNLINNHIYKTYFETIVSKNANDVDLFNIGVNIKNKFNNLFKDEGKIDYVIIENQIGPLAIRMKTIQGMIVQYFIMSGLNVEHIEFISASNKLKDCDVKDKEKYSDRKKLGIAKCLGILIQDFRFNEHTAYFNSHKKKDDLSDSFLQGMWFINNKKL